MTASRLLGMLALCVAASSPARAQGLPVSVAVGLGGGWAGATCEGCVASNENGRSGLVQLAVPVRGGMRLGAEYNRWSKDQFGQPSAFEYFMTIAEIPFMDVAGLTVKTGVGYGRTRYRQWDVTPAPVTTERSGFAYELGLGYDIPVNRRLVIAPYAQGVMTSRGPARVNGQASPEDHSTSMLQYGLMLRMR